MAVKAKSATRGEIGDGVHVGDAFDLINRVAADSVDLIITSPPYWGLRSYGLKHNPAVLDEWVDAGCSPARVPPYEWYRNHGGVLGLEPYPDWYVSHLVEFFARAKSVLKSTGSIWVNLGDTYFARWGSVRDAGRQGIANERTRRRTPTGGYLHDKQLLLIPARFAIAMQELGWILRNDLIWSKPHVMPRPESDRLRLSHEHWFHFVRRRTSQRPSYHYDLREAEAGARDVVSYQTPSGSNGHSATFPPDLVRRRITSSCPPGGLVCDPFCGTGVAVVEAHRSGRRGIGFEISASYARKARNAVKKSVNQDPGGATRQVSKKVEAPAARGRRK